MAVLAVVAGCRSAAPEPDPAAPRPVHELGRYTVRKDGRRLGTLVYREIDDPRGAVRFYLVENDAGQWLGYADPEGRFFRYEPFRADEHFLGVYTMDSGLSLLYDVQPPLSILPEARDSTAREASAPRLRHP